MSRSARQRRLRSLLLCALAAGVFGCGGATYSAGYYGSSWGYRGGWGYPYPCCYGGGTVIVRPPHHRPPHHRPPHHRPPGHRPPGGRPPHVRPPRPPSQLPSRPRPRPQPRRRGALEDAVQVVGVVGDAAPDARLR